MATFVEHVVCMRCGKRCSGVDPELGLVVRAWVECPECLEMSEGKELGELRAAVVQLEAAEHDAEDEDITSREIAVLDAARALFRRV